MRVGPPRCRPTFASRPSCPRRSRTNWRYAAPGRPWTVSWMRWQDSAASWAGCYCSCRPAWPSMHAPLPVSSPCCGGEPRCPSPASHGIRAGSRRRPMPCCCATGWREPPPIRPGCRKRRFPAPTLLALLPLAWLTADLLQRLRRPRAPGIGSAGPGLGKGPAAPWVIFDNTAHGFAIRRRPAPENVAGRAHRLGRRYLPAPQLAATLRNLARTGLPDGLVSWQVTKGVGNAYIFVSKSACRQT